MQKIFPCPRISLFDCWCSSCPVFSGRIWSAMDRPGAINWSNTTSSRISKQINKHKKTVKFFYQNLLQKIFSNKFSQIVCYRDGKYSSGDTGSSNERELGVLFWRTVLGRSILRRPGPGRLGRITWRLICHRLYLSYWCLYPMIPFCTIITIDFLIAMIIFWVNTGIIIVSGRIVRFAGHVSTQFRLIFTWRPDRETLIWDKTTFGTKKIFS